MKWISVKDELPELSTKNGIKEYPSEVVIIHVPTNDRMVAGFLTKYGWQEYPGTSCGCCMEDDPIPTHWMPIIKPQESL